MDLEKNERISKEKKKLTSTFSKLDPKAKKVLQSLIENAAFMAITLQDLQKTMNEKGVVSEYQNGENQWGTKKSPEVEIYNSMIKNYSTVIKQLADLLPTGKGEKDDALALFLKKQNK